ncbi:MAG: hypothetical protein ACW964_00210 [Candidatus Hodarchaeales archaeon]|jgi:hypothetical protein
MKPNCFLDLTLASRKQISFEMTLEDRNHISFEMLPKCSSYSIGAKLGKLDKINYTDDILHLSFDNGDLRLEIVIEELYHFLNPLFEQIQRKRIV